MNVLKQQQRPNLVLPRPYKYSFFDIVVIILIVLLVVGIIVAFSFLIKNLIKKEMPNDLIFYSTGENKVELAYFKKKNCRKYNKFEVGDKIILYDKNNIPIYFTLDETDNMVYKLNYFCNSKLKITNADSFSDSLLSGIVVNDTQELHIKKAFEYGTLAVNPFHQDIFKLEPKTLFDNFIESATTDNAKFINNVLYLNVHKYYFQDNTEYKFSSLINDTTTDIETNTLSRLKRYYNVWKTHLEQNFKDVFVTIKTHIPGIDKELEIEDLDELNNKKDQIKKKSSSSETSNFHRYTVHFYKQNSNEDLHKLYNINKKKLDNFLKLVKDADYFSEKKQILDKFDYVSKYVFIVDRCRELTDSFNEIEILENSLIDNKELDIYLNQFDPASSNIDAVLDGYNKKYYSIQRINKETSDKKIIFENSVDSENYFLNNLKYIADKAFSTLSLREIVIGDEYKPVNLDNFRSFNLKSFLKDDNTFLDFKIHIGNVHEEFKLYDPSPSYTVKTMRKEIDNMEQLVKAKHILRFHKSNYKFLDNIKKDISTVKKDEKSDVLEKNKIIIQKLQQIDENGVGGIFKRAQFSLYTGESIFGELLNTIVYKKENLIKEDFYYEKTSVQEPKPKNITDLESTTTVDNSLECSNKCKKTEGCEYFIYENKDKTCKLFETNDYDEVRREFDNLEGSTVTPRETSEEYHIHGLKKLEAD